MDGQKLEDLLNSEGKLRIVQELVPGKQITIAHIIANPDKILYQKLGINPAIPRAPSASSVCLRRKPRSSRGISR